MALFFFYGIKVAAWLVKLSCIAAVITAPRHGSFSASERYF